MSSILTTIDKSLTSQSQLLIRTEKLLIIIAMMSPDDLKSEEQK